MKAKDAVANALLTEWPDWGREAYAEAILAALDAAGYAVVPKEPTPEMIIAAESAGVRAAFRAVGLSPSHIAPSQPMLTAAVYRAILVAAKQGEGK